MWSMKLKHRGKDKTKKGNKKANIEPCLKAQFCGQSRDKKLDHLEEKAACMHERLDAYGCKERVRQSRLQETLTKDNDVNSAHDSSIFSTSTLVL